MRALSRTVLVLHIAVPAIVLPLVAPGFAWAQSADDVASRVGTVARKMGAVARDPWSLESTFSADMSRGNTDSTNLRSTIVYVRDSGAWRFGSYVSGAIESDDGRRSKERAGLNLALAHRYREEFQLVLIEEIVRAPLDGLSARNLLGGMLVWTPYVEGPIESSIYVGAGWASERFSDSRVQADYGAGLAGATASIDLSASAELNLVASYTQDLQIATNYKIGASAALKASVNSVLGLQVSYSVAYDHDAADDRARANNAISAGLTLGWKGVADDGGAEVSFPFVGAGRSSGRF